MRARGVPILAVLVTWLWPGSSGSLHAYIDYPYLVNFQTIRIPHLPRDETYGLEDKRWAIRVSANWMNVWSLQSNRFIIDGEEFQIEPTLRYSVTEHTQVGISASLKTLSGGVLDPLIERFHSATRVTQGLRDRYPRDKLNVSYEPYGPYYPWIDDNPLKTWLRRYDWRIYPRQPGNPPVRLPTPQANLLPTERIALSGSHRSGIGDPRVFLQTVLWSGEQYDYIDTVIGGIQFKLPAGGGEMLATPGVDTSAYVVFRRTATPARMGWRVGLSYTRFEMREFLPLRLPDHQWVLRPGLDYMPNENWSLSLEYVFFSAPTRDFGRLSKPGHLVLVGVRRLYADLIVSFGVAENFGNFAVTPDIGFHVSVERRL